MSNIYVLPKNSIFEIFEDLNNFLDKIDIFKQYQPNYRYEVRIIKSNIEEYKWELRLKVWNDESKENKIHKEVENPFGVL